MRRSVVIPVITGTILALASASAASAIAGQRGLSVSTLRGYLDQMGLRYVPHPKSSNALVVTRSSNDHADRLDLYIDIRDDNTVVLTAYAKEKGRYFNVSRADDREGLFKRLLEANHRAFTTFFVDEQGDIGARFTFTSENGVGFESFRVASTELLRIVDHYTPVLDGFMRKEDDGVKRQPATK